MWGNTDSSKSEIRFKVRKHPWDRKETIENDKGGIGFQP